MTSIADLQFHAERVAKGARLPWAGRVWKADFLEALAGALPAHGTYVEPFAGSLTCLLAKERAPREVVAEQEPERASMWRTLQRLSKEEIGVLLGADWRPEEHVFKAHQAVVPTGAVDRLARSLYLVRYSKDGQGEEWQGDTGRPLPVFERLAERLKGVRVYAKGWEEVAAAWDAPDSFLLFDPPAGVDVESVLAKAKVLKGRWALVTSQLPAAEHESVYIAVPEAADLDALEVAKGVIDAPGVFVLVDGEATAAVLRKASGLRWFRVEGRPASDVPPGPLPRVVPSQAGVSKLVLLREESLHELMGRIQEAVDAAHVEGMFGGKPPEPKPGEQPCSPSGCGLRDVYETTVVVDRWDRGASGERLWRADWEQAEDGSVTLSNAVQVKVAYVEVEPPAEGAAEEPPAEEYTDEEKADVEKAIWGSPAGKSRLAKRIVAMLPKHTTYVEPFAGSAAVLFVKEPSDTEVINDSNGDIAEAFRAVQGLSEADMAALRKMEWKGSKNAFLKIFDSEPKGRLEKPHRFLYISKFSYASLRKRSFDPSKDGMVIDVVGRVEKQRGRLKGVKVYSGDYETVCRKYDGAGTAFFLDPPYAGYDVKVGEREFDEARFVAMLKSLKGKWLLTYGVRGKLPAMLKEAGFQIKRFSTPRSIRHMRGVGGDERLMQLFAGNYDFSAPVAKAMEEDGWVEVSEADATAFALADDAWEEIQKAQPFGTFGGSAKYAKRLVPLIPAHKTYVEPFCGAAAVFHHKEPSDQEVLADIDDTVLFMHRYIKGMTPEKLERLRKFKWLVTRQTFNLARDMDPSDDAERFWKLVFFRTHAHNANPWAKHPARNHLGSTTNPEKYLKFAPRYKGVKIEHRSWEQTLAKYDAKDTFFFVAPPYPGEWPDKQQWVDVQDMVTRLAKLKGKFVAVINDSPENRALFKQCGRLFQLQVTEALGTGGAKQATRLFAANFPVAGVVKAAGLDGVEDVTDDLPERQVEVLDVGKAQWSTSYVNDLPDAAFAVILPGGTKDEGGRTTPRELRKLPHHTTTVTSPTDNDTVDPAHLRNALARLSQTDGLSGAQREEARAHLEAHAQALGIGASAEQKAADEQVVSKPGWDETPNQWRYRVREPGDFRPDTFRVFQVPGIEGVQFILGRLQPGKVPEGGNAEASVVQSVHFARDKWARADAEKWVADHAGSFGEVKEATAKADAPAEADEHYVLGIVLEPNDGSDAPLKPDTQGDVYSSGDIRKTAFGYMQDYQKVGLLHRGVLDKQQAVVVESYLAPVDFQITDRLGKKRTVRKGTWLMGTLVLDDALWGAVKEGKINAYSVGGVGRREPVAAPAKE